MKSAFFVVLGILLLSPPAGAQDSPAAPEAAAVRLADLADIKATVAEAIGQMAASLPEDRRERFAQAAATAVDREHLESQYRALLAGVFTTEELTALANFYDSPAGRPIAAKLPRLTALTIPLVQAELIRAMERLHEGKKDSP